MKFFSTLSGLIILCSLLIVGNSPLSSCTKKETVIDTVYDLKDGLVAYYTFTAGSLKDGSDYGNDITFNNAVSTTDRFGKSGNAFLFDGSSSFMQIKNSPSLNPDNITISAFVKVNGFYAGPCHGNVIVGKGSPDNVYGYYTLRFSDLSCGTSIDSSHEQFFASYGDNIPNGNAAGAIVTGSYVQKGTWYHLAYSYNGIVSKIYLNGVLVSTIQKPSVPFTDNTSDVLIGKLGSDIYPYYFNGVIDDVRIYNRALPDAAIQQLYNAKN